MLFPIGKPAGREESRPGRGAERGDAMAKRKKRVATVSRKLGTAISCRVQKPFLKDLDAYRP
jgi:hypothetical protein